MTLHIKFDNKHFCRTCCYEYSFVKKEKNKYFYKSLINDGFVRKLKDNIHKQLLLKNNNNWIPCNIIDCPDYYEQEPDDYTDNGYGIILTPKNYYYIVLDEMI